MIELRSSIKHCLLSLATLSRNSQFAKEAGENSLTEAKSNPVSNIIG
jgi:hypothetical protein